MNRHNFIILFLGTCAFIAIYVATSTFGVGVMADGVAYIQCAQNIVQGNGITLNDGSTISHWPPMYPLTIATITMISELDIIQSARLLNAIGFAALIVLIGALNKRLGLSEILSAASMIIVGLSPINQMYLSVNSEVIFLPILIAVSIFTINICERYSLFDFSVLILLSALLWSIRYAGIFFVVGVAVAILMSEKKKLTTSTIYSIFNIVFFILTLFILKNNNSQSSLREIAFHPISTSHAWSFLSTLGTWITPNKVDYIRVAFGSALLLMIILSFTMHVFQIIKKIIDTKVLNTQSPQFILITMSMSYIMLLLANISFIDYSTPIDQRILSPVFTLWLIAFIIPFSTHVLNRKTELLCAAVFGIIISQHWSNTANHFHGQRLYGTGFTGLKWQEILDELSTHITSSQHIYTNATDAIEFRFPKMNVSELPRKYNEFTDTKVHGVESHVLKVCEELRNKESIIVYFTNITWRPFFTDMTMFSELCGESVRIIELNTPISIVESNSVRQY